MKVMGPRCPLCSSSGAADGQRGTQTGRSPVGTTVVNPDAATGMLPDGRHSYNRRAVGVRDREAPGDRAHDGEIGQCIGRAIAADKVTVNKITGREDRR
jgi:hypothetical protein